MEKVKLARTQETIAEVPDGTQYVIDMIVEHELVPMYDSVSERKKSVKTRAVNFWMKHCGKWIFYRYPPLDYYDMEKLWQMQNSLSLEDFKECFKDKAEHLWRQFSETYRHNLLSFWKYLGNDEEGMGLRFKLIKYIGPKEIKDV